MHDNKISLETAEEKELSRRGLLKKAGKIVAGAAGIAAVSSAGISLPSRAYAKKTKFPWGYKKLDPVRVGKIAYEGYYKDYCCYGVAKGILLPLQEDIGEPFTLFPLESTIWGQGGTVGWGTLCGALNGAGTAISIVAGKEGHNILNDLIAWYSKAELPIYKPSNPRTKIRRKSMSDSALCHVSVGKWMEEEGVPFLSPEVMERCGRLTADVAIKAVELLNTWVDGKYKPVNDPHVGLYEMPATTLSDCKSCHGRKIPEIPGK